MLFDERGVRAWFEVVSGQSSQQFRHRGLLLLDRLQQFELRAASVQVLSGPARLVVCVAAQKVLEEPDSLFEHNHLRSGNQRITLLRAHEVACTSQKSA